MAGHISLTLMVDFQADFTGFEYHVCGGLVRIMPTNTELPYIAS